MLLIIYEYHVVFRAVTFQSYASSCCVELVARRQHPASFPSNRSNLLRFALLHKGWRDIANSLQGTSTRRTLQRGERWLKVANEVRADAEAIGVLTLDLSNGSKLILNNVLYVPSLSRNLISVSCLADDGYDCHFGKELCEI